MVGEEIVVMAGTLIRYSLENLKEARQIGHIEEVSWDINSDDLNDFPERMRRSDKLYKGKEETPENYLKRIFLQDNSLGFMPLVGGLPDSEPGVEITHNLSRLEIELESKTHLPVPSYLSRSNERAKNKKGDTSAIMPAGKANLKFDLKYIGEAKNGLKLIDTYELQGGIVGSKVSGEYYTRARVKLPVMVSTYEATYKGWEEYDPRELEFCNEELERYKEIQSWESPTKFRRWILRPIALFLYKNTFLSKSHDKHNRDTKYEWLKPDKLQFL